MLSANLVNDIGEELFDLLRLGCANNNSDALSDRYIDYLLDITLTIRLIKVHHRVIIFKHIDLLDFWELMHV